MAPAIESETIEIDDFATPLHEVPSRARPRPVLHLGAALLLLAGWGAAWLNADHAAVRTESAALNHFLYAAAMLLPVIAVPVAATGFRRRRTRWIVGTAGALLLSPVILVSLSLALFAVAGGVSTIERGHDPGLLPLRRLPVDGGRSEVVVHRTSCGATCAYGAEVRHEQRLLPGLRLVRDIGGRYPAEDAAVEVSGGLAVRVDGEEVRLRRWVWFGRRGGAPRPGGAEGDGGAAGDHAGVARSSTVMAGSS